MVREREREKTEYPDKVIINFITQHKLTCLTITTQFCITK